MFWYERFSWFWCEGTRCWSLSKYFRYALYSLLTRGFRIEHLYRFFLGSGPFSSMFLSILWLIQLDSIFLHGATGPSGPGPPHYRGFTITLRHTTVGRAPLDEWSASTWQHSQDTNIHAPCGIRTHIPRKTAAAHPRLIPRGRYERHVASYTSRNSETRRKA